MEDLLIPELSSSIIEGDRLTRPLKLILALAVCKKAASVSLALICTEKGEFFKLNCSAQI